MSGEVHNTAFHLFIVFIMSLICIREMRILLQSGPVHTNAKKKVRE
jgi:hypothetical protein